MNKTFTYKVPKENCMPKHLFELFCDLRNYLSGVEAKGIEEEVKQLLLSDTEIESVIETAFLVSLKKEEGKFPQLRLLIPKKIFNFDRGNRLVTFKKDITFDAINLTKLSPTTNDLNYALLLGKGESGLLIDCMLAVSDKDNFDITNPMNNVQPLDGLTIRIDGPGNIRFHYKSYTFELKEGVIEEKSNLKEIPFVSDWYEHLYQLITPKVKEKYLEGFPSGTNPTDMQINVHETLPQFINLVWEYILATTIKLKKGGAYTILPAETNPDEYKDAIKIKYPALDINIVDKIVDYWVACLNAKNKSDDKVLLLKCIEAKTKLFNQVNALVNLSQADGCVVLDRNLNFIGFGGFIKAIANEKSKCLKMSPGGFDKDKEVQVFQQEEVQVLELGGARHQSAYSLCDQVKDALLFTVSQDGEIKVFTHDKNKGCVCMCKAQGTSLSYEW